MKLFEAKCRQLQERGLQLIQQLEVFLEEVTDLGDADSATAVLQSIDSVEKELSPLNAIVDAVDVSFSSLSVRSSRVYSTHLYRKRISSLCKLDVCHS